MIIGNYPTTRPRRLRQAPWIRNLVSETKLSTSDLILPLFIRENDGAKEILAMPGIQRYAIDELPKLMDEVSSLGIPMVALFPYTTAEKRTPHGDEALNPNNLICQAIKIIKGHNPDIGVMTDVALDPYTDHAHDGILKNGCVDNELSIEILAQQALNQVQAGADAIAPSDMMDGRIGVIRDYLDSHGYTHPLIIAYAAKYASSFYGPFRQAVGVETLLGPKDKKTYQMDSANGEEAIKEAALDIQEGADVVIVKPGLPYLDIIHRIKSQLNIPIFAYQVSGEYAMVKAASQNGWVDGEKVMMESLIALKRAGSSAILTYAALEAAKLLKREIV